MNHNKLTLITLSALVPFLASARTVTSAEAGSIASRFFEKSGIETSAIAPAATPLSIGNHSPAYYVFNADGSNGGFVIVAGDDRMGNVLGYSTSGAFSLDGAPESLVGLMEMYEHYMKALSDSPSITMSPQSAGTPAMQPLLGEIAWGQDTPFNTMCPTYSEAGATKNYYTGCVVTAATQIMKFYNYPQTGTGSKSYMFSGNTLSADFGNTSYRWSDMPAAVPESPSALQKMAYSTLAYHFGVAVEMQYAKDGSGAYTQMVPAALRDYFGYDAGVKMRPREYYSTQEWVDMIKAELDAGRPVYYGASSDSGVGGHAFVCDGYDSNDYMHINWGWYGRSNGYFLVNHLDPSSLGEGGGTGGYNRSQEVITGICPATADNVYTPSVYGATRLSCVSYDTELTLMSFVENIDTRAFSGLVGALLVKDGKVVKALGSQSVNIAGFAGGRTGSEQIYMRSVLTSATDIPDGEDYRINMGVLPEGSTEWIVLRHPIGLPSYIEASVKNGRVIVGEQHQPKPDVVLLDSIATDGALHANGHALFKFNITNKSADCRLKNITVRLTSLSDASITADLTADVNIYDMSTEQFDLIMPVPATVAPGTYSVTAFETSHPDRLFDDSSVGRAHVTVLPESSTPILRLTESPAWRNSEGVQTVRHGDYLYITAPARNYGAQGNAAVIARLTSTDNPERSYVFLRQDVTCAKGKEVSLMFYRKAAMDAGQYRVDLLMLDSEGNEQPIESAWQPAVVEIGTSDIADIEVTDFDLPSQLSTDGERQTYTVAVRATKDFSGTFIIRIRQFTNKSGEIVYMRSGVSLKAGQETSFSFKYKASVDPGSYMVMVETRPNGVASGNENPALGLDNYYRELTVSNLAGIGSVNPDATGTTTIMIDRSHISCRSPYAIQSMTLFDLGGRIAATSRGADSISVATLPKGIYILEVRTENGSETFKLKL